MTVNGAEIYYETRGEGEPLVLLHGFTGVGSDWNHVFDRPPEGYRLIVPDLRGHGRSNNPSGEFTHRQAAQDVLALLDCLEIATCQAIGMSCGGNVLLHMATLQPDRLAAMVLVSATTHFPEPARAIMRQLTVEDRTEEQWQLMRQRHVFGEAQILDLWRQEAGFQDSHDDLSFTASDLSRITARALILQGDRDPLYPVTIATEMFASISRSHLWILPNAGHVPIFGDAAPAFVETTQAFLRGDWEPRS